MEESYSLICFICLKGATPAIVGKSSSSGRVSVGDSIVAALCLESDDAWDMDVEPPPPIESVAQIDLLVPEASYKLECQSRWELTK